MFLTRHGVSIGARGNGAGGYLCMKKAGQALAQPMVDQAYPVLGEVSPAPAPQPFA